MESSVVPTFFSTKAWLSFVPRTTFPASQVGSATWSALGAAGGGGPGGGAIAGPGGGAPGVAGGASAARTAAASATRSTSAAPGLTIRVSDLCAARDDRSTASRAGGALPSLLERLAAGEGDQRRRDLRDGQDEVDVVVDDGALRHPGVRRLFRILRDRDAAGGLDRD